MSGASASERGLALVVVLGDIGRSPRMCMHATALASVGYRVELIGYVDSPVGAQIAEDPNICVRPLASPKPASSSRSLYLLGVVPRLLGALVEFVTVLRRLGRGDVILLQNPPAVYVLPILIVYARLHRSRLIVDWHNFGWTVLGLRLGKDHWIVRLSGRIELWLARYADIQLCVSDAMGEWLAEHAELEAVTVRDHPGERFVAMREHSRSDLVREVCSVLRLGPELLDELLDRRRILLVSSTSWSADEDFDVLIRALRSWRSEKGDPRLLVLLSGRGPRRDHFKEEILEADLRDVEVHTVWLEDADYPAFLAAADFGLCLHRSSSGVDLPMKVADMLGVGLPVCVLDYGECLREVVSDGENGFLFRDEVDLVDLLRKLCRHSEGRGVIQMLRDRIASLDVVPWRQNWLRHALPAIEGASGTTVR